MAELAVGLSKSVVVGAITKVQSAIEEDARLRAKAKRDLVFITMEFDMIRSFLDDANQEMMSVKRKLVATWVENIRQLAYEVEDCVQNVVNLDDKPVLWRRFLPPCIAPELPLDLAVEELEQLKERVKDVNKCYRRYNLLNDSEVSKLAAATQQQQRLRLPPPPPPGACHMLAEARDATKRQQCLLGNHTQLTPKKMWQECFSRLIQLITKRGNNDLQVISVWGSEGDQGTTSIIRKAYDDEEIVGNFHNRFWVKLTHPFSPPQDFIRSFMAQFYASSSNEEGTAPGVHVLRKMEATKADMFLEFERLVTREKYLLVLEGLSNMVDWDAIRTFLPDKKSGSCIVVSTHQPEIASLCVGHPYRIFELKRFSDEHSVCALLKEPPVVPPQDSRFSSSQKEEAQYWKSKPELAERKSEINELKQYLSITRSSRSGVMSVLGMAGVGKSALVRNLYYEQMLHTKEFEKYIWVDVSHPLNSRDLSRALLPECNSEEDPICLLEQHRCLVVIDDLRYKEEWDLVKDALVSRPSASVIIVITTEASVAKYCTADNEGRVLNVKCLGAAAAFSLFKTEVHRINSSFRSNSNQKVQELVIKCGGLPRVIIAIAGLLAQKMDEFEDTVSHLNDRFAKHLEGFDSLRCLFGWVHHFIVNPPEFLKPCIFYLSIFSREDKVRRRRVLRRWISEGYSKDSVAEKNAEKFFSELIKMGIFLQVPQLATTDERMVFCEVNPFIRQYIISMKFEDLVFKLGGNCAIGISTQKRGRHLIILDSWDKDEVLFKSLDFSRLWSVTVFGEWKSFFISESMKLLRVLDLEDASGVEDADLDNIVKLLCCLQFLSLRGCTEIYHLPGALGNLKHLQTLDVRGTSILTLPASITRLKKLQYIRAGSTIPTTIPPPLISSSSCLPCFCCSRRRHRVGVKVPVGIEKLTALHTFGVVNIDYSGVETIVEVLKSTKQLRKLGVSGINKHNCGKFVSSLSGHAHLESLSIQLDKDNEGCLENMVLPWEKLQSLKLYGVGDKLPLRPAQSCGSEMLRKLDLEMATLGKENIVFLANLPQLCILRLCVKQIHDSKLKFYAENEDREQLDTFKKVKILEIAGRSSMLHVTFVSKAMRNLELLKIDYSRASYSLTGLDHLHELKSVLLKGTSDETIKTQLQSQLANHPKTPEVMLEKPSSSSMSV